MAKKAQTAKRHPETSLVLRVCRADMGSSHEFVWPGVDKIAVAPDWINKPSCGNGLHGWLHGQGDHGCTSLYEQADAKWIVVEVETAAIIQLGGKVKFPAGLVKFVGDRKSATDYLISNDPIARSVAVIGAQLQVGDKESVMVGALGQATAGNRGTATAGDSGTATAGDSGTATAGDSGTATAGYGGTATAGYGGTATAGNRGTATAGYGGTATAGYGGTLQIKWWDSPRQNYRIVTGYVGEDGIKANKPYVLDVNHKLVEKKS